MRGGLIVQYSVRQRFGSQFLVGVITILLVPFFSGCGGNDGPPFGQVMGKVTLDGQPIQAGMVMFIPDSASGTVGPASQAQIGSDGQYELMGPGAARGQWWGLTASRSQGPK